MIIVPARKTWTSFAEDAPPMGDDFPVERPGLVDTRRIVRVAGQLHALLPAPHAPAASTRTVTTSVSWYW